MLTIYWDPKPDLFILPVIHLPILWYGVLFATGFILGFPIFVSILTRYLRLVEGAAPEAELKRKAVVLTDRLTIYIVIATVLGARLGHFIFYEEPSTYLNDPWELLRIWEGGLASHGAAIAIIVAMILFSYRIRDQVPGLNWIRLLDFVSIPTALAGACIRLGNFFNQEILGTLTSVPWAVVFGHPADRSIPAPRHPVQLYECIFYLAVFFLLWRLSYRLSFLQRRGKLVGLFLILVFGFRFFIEFFKTEQSELLSFTSPLTMGQYLSLPTIIVGLLFYICNRK